MTSKDHVQDKGPASSIRRKITEYRWIAGTIRYLAPVIAIIGIAIPLLLSLQTFAIVSLYAAIPVVLASASYTITDGFPRTLDTTIYSFGWPSRKVVVSIYLIFQGLSLFSLALTDVRPLAYYVFIALAAGTILFQILGSDTKPTDVALILVEAGVLLVNILWSVTLNYAYFFGRTDVFPHDLFLQSLLETHRVTPTFGEYEAFPLWHILIGFQTMLFDHVLAPLGLFFVTTGILYGVGTAGVYALARRFELSKTVSLVAALGMCAHPFVVLYGMYSIPRSITSILVPLLFILLILNTLRATVLFGALVTGIAVFHTISLPFIFVTAGCYYVVERYLRSSPEDGRSQDGPVISTFELALIIGIQFLYWVIANPELIARLIGLVLESGNYGADVGGGLSEQFIEKPFNELVNYLPFSLLIFFILFGLYQTSRATEFSYRGKCVLLTTLLLAVVSFPGPMLLVNVVSNLTADNVLRFAQYTYPFVVIAFAVGVVAVAKTRFRIELGRGQIALALLLVSASVFLTVSNDFVASDNPMVERDDFYTFYLSESEINGFQFVSTHADSAVTADYVACRYLNNPGRGDCRIIQADPVEERLHFPSNSPLILRKGELEDRPLSIYPTREVVDEPPYSNHRDSLGKSSDVWESLWTKNRVYDSPTVTAYTAR